MFKIACDCSQTEDLDDSLVDLLFVSQRETNAFGLSDARHTYDFGTLLLVSVS